MEQPHIPTVLAEHLPFWKQLTEQQRSILISGTSCLSYSADATLHSTDSQCIGMLLVLSGSLRVYLLSEEGREITLYRIYQDEVCVLSASCVLKSITFDVFIDAVEDCQVLQLTASSLNRIVKENIHAECFSYKMATERFSDVMWAMQQILFMSFDKRLAIFLLDESAMYQSDELSMTHQQIARLMGTAREVVTRMLHYFSSEGYVALSRGIVRLTDKPGLRKLL